MIRTLLLLGCCAAVLSGCYAQHSASRPDVDAGVSGPSCGATRCPIGYLCCPGCPGEPSTCAEDACPDLSCPAPECDDATPCPATMFCEREGCAATGVCRPRPEACDPECPEVCGCDGVTYCAACDANAAGVSVAHAGACEPPSECAGLSYCACQAAADCAPTVNVHSGCVCPCDDPFNCTGVDCACDCGGAEYLGCVPRDCPTQGEIGCDPASCELRRDARGCIECVCDP